MRLVRYLHPGADHKIKVHLFVTRLDLFVDVLRLIEQDGIVREQLLEASSRPCLVEKAFSDSLPENKDGIVHVLHKCIIFVPTLQHSRVQLLELGLQEISDLYLMKCLTKKVQLRIAFILFFLIFSTCFSFWDVQEWITSYRLHVCNICVETALVSKAHEAGRLLIHEYVQLVEQLL